MRKVTVAIIDYELGNLFSIRHACEKVGMETLVTRDEKVINKADFLILPGVGSYPHAMQKLIEFSLVEPIHKFIKSGRNLLGICLGAQLLLSSSEEFERTAGLGLIEGNVNSIRNSLMDKTVKVPHIGWNSIFANPSNGNILDWLSPTLLKEKYYFVHSYFMEPHDHAYVLASTNYSGIEFASIVGKGNLIGIQFHPERSGPAGLDIYEGLKEKVKNEL